MGNFAAVPASARSTCQLAASASAYRDVFSAVPVEAKRCRSPQRLRAERWPEQGTRLRGSAGSPRDQLPTRSSLGGFHDGMNPPSAHNEIFGHARPALKPPEQFDDRMVSSFSTVRPAAHNTDRAPSPHREIFGHTRPGLKSSHRPECITAGGLKLPDWWWADNTTRGDAVFVCAPRA